MFRHKPCKDDDDEIPDEIPTELDPEREGRVQLEFLDPERKDGERERVSFLVRETKTGRLCEISEQDVVRRVAAKRREASGGEQEEEKEELEGEQEEEKEELEG